MEHHELLIEAQMPGEVLYVCSRPDCGRRLVAGVDGLTVIDKGDFFATHSGGSPGLRMNVSVIR
ncbi:hypothetical protein [Cryptosporangium arvum]|uniref:hypothetical protein n=1 Tax=Cryptosporangium arvum TaxID=80871 RepID=UPI0012ED56DC|nr:hypothetical protein [Cryptosporangium arvum]